MVSTAWYSFHSLITEYNVFVKYFIASDKLEFCIGADHENIIFVYIVREGVLAV